MTVLCLAAFLALSYFTRAPGLRMVGAAGAGAAIGIVALLALEVGEAQGWWTVPRARVAFFRSTFCLAFVVQCAPLYLITWRVAHRAGAVGLALCVAAAAILGPARDYAFGAVFPNWIVFSPGIAPLLALAVAYALLVAVGHAVMRTVAGPSQRGLARQG